MNEYSQRHDDEELQAPAKLIEALADLHNERVFVPPPVDEAILNEAKGHLGKLPRRTFRRSPLPYWAAVAASFVLVAWLVYTFVKPFPALNGKKAFAREDINHDGRVDILDAFALARQIEHQKPEDRTWDFNGDGVVDVRDADTVAARAVKLVKGGNS